MNVLEIHACNHCNLNCQGCLHFSPIADEWFLEPDDLDNNLSQISEDVKNIFDEINILGGEPLLNKNLDIIMKIIRKHFSLKITIVTNGIKIRDKKELLSACKMYDINIGVTRYPTGIDYIKLKDYIKNNGVNYIYYNDCRNKPFLHFCLDKNGNGNDKYSFDNCPLRTDKNYLQLCGTLLYKCCISAYVHIFNKKFKTNIPENACIDLSKKSLDDVYAFLESPSIMCKYCNIDNIYNVEWKHSQKTENEWL